MSDQWEFYLSTLDEKPASIFFDAGIADNHPLSGFPHLGYIRLALKTPRDDGLSCDSENQALADIEDAMIAQLKTSQGFYVGRTTAAAVRYFYFYLADPNIWQEFVEKSFEPFTGYTPQFGTRPDPDWLTYFELLCPTAIEKTIIANRKVCEHLMHQGDALDTPRQIHHWILFDSAEDRNRFAEAVNMRGFQLVSLSEPGQSSTHSDRYGIEIYSTAIPSFDSINNITIPLFNLAAKYRGNYSGWDTTLIPSLAPATS